MDMNVPQLSHDSNGPWMVWSSWALTGLSSAFLALRCYCRTSRNQALWWDDYVLILAWMMLVASAVMVTYNVSQGFGEHIYNVGSEKLPMVGLLAQVDLVFEVLGVAWSKTSWAITLLHLSRDLLRHMVIFIIITINLFLAISIVFNFIQCIPSRKLWEPYLEGACWPSQIVPIYSTISGVYSGAMDITLALLPWFLIMKVHMRLTERIGVAVAMSCGIFAGATAFVKSSYVINLGSKDPIYDTAPLVVWGHAEIAVTIIAASIPVLRVLVKDVSKSLSSSRQRTNSQANTASYNKSVSTNRGTTLRRLPNSLFKGTTDLSSVTTTCIATLVDRPHNNIINDNYKSYDGVYPDALSTSTSQHARGLSRDDSSERDMLPPMVP